MKAKFPEFDEYQLAKYNKAPVSVAHEEGMEEEEWQSVLRARDYTIKRLVRICHVMLSLFFIFSCRFVSCTWPTRHTW